ncbi:MAG: translocation/assembly module TamB [Bacteroidales bacterium]|nr:translocation/assembly module TamB [Bacteroidales bacterium]
MALWLGVTLYVVVALANYSVVQSLAGAAASRHFTKAWGGETRVGSLSANLFDHLVLRDILMVNPEGDTVAVGEKIAVRFRRFPVSGGGLNLEHVLLKNVTYHFSNDTTGINLSYITDYYKKPQKDTTRHGAFVVRVKHLVMRDVCYKMNLNAKPHVRKFPYGVYVQDMEFRNINARMRNVRVDADHVTCRFDRFAAREKSGFGVQNIKGNVYVARNGISVTDFEVQTDSSDLRLDAMLKYTDWESMGQYIDSVYMCVSIHPGSVANMVDAAWWAPALWGMDSRIALEGYVHGPVADIHAEDFWLRFGKGSEVHLDAAVNGLPRIDSTIFDCTLHRLASNYEDLTAVNHPPRYKVKVPQLLEQLGAFDMSATMRGSIKDFNAQATVNSTEGTLDLLADMRYNERERGYAYQLEAASEQFQVARLWPNEWLKDVGFRITADGIGFDPKRMKGTLEGTLSNVQTGATRLDAAKVKVTADRGRYSADVSVDDAVADMDVQCRVVPQDDRMQSQVDAHVRHLDMKALGIAKNEEDSLLTVSTQLKVRASWQQEAPLQSALNSMTGTVRMNDTRLAKNNSLLKLDDVKLQADMDNGRRKLKLTSDILDANVEGYFDYEDFPMVAQRFCNQFVPVYYNPFADKPVVDDYAPIADVMVDMTAVWTDGKHHMEDFLPKLRVSKGTRLWCTYNFTESMKLVVTSDSIAMGGIQLRNVAVNGHDVGGRYKTDVDVDALMLGATELMSGTEIVIFSTSDEATCSLDWNDHHDPVSKGSLELLLQSDMAGNTLRLMNSNIVLRGDVWDVENTTPIAFAKNYLRVDGVRISSEDQMLLAQASKAQQEDDKIGLTVDNFQLGQLDFLLGNAGISLDGIVDGNVHVSDYSKIPHINVRLDVEDCVVNDQPLGDALLRSHWDAQRNRLYLSLDTRQQTDIDERQPLKAQGYVDLASKNRDMEFNVDFDGFSLESVAPLLSSFSSHLEGELHGSFVIAGSLEYPQLRGDAYIEKASLLVDALNVQYTIDDTISFTNNEILFDHIAIHDPQNNTALLSGKITHSHWNDFNFDLVLDTRNLMLLNTTARDATYYGKLYGAATAVVSGPMSDMSVNVIASTRPGSSLTLPVNNKKQVKELGYIRFDNVEVESDRDARGRRAENGGLDGFSYRLVANVEVTPDVRLNIPMDFSQMYADATAVASGELRYETATDRKPTLTGACEIASGSMNLTFMSILQKEFSISSGSSILFPGNISDATFSLEAVYQQRVNMSSLTGSDASIENSSKVIPVQNVILLSGTLQNPEVNFDIRLPNVDPSVEEEVFSYVDRSNERDMLNQTLSLLLLSQFYNNTTSGSSSPLDNGLSSGYAVLANSVGNVVSNMVQFVNVNFDYSAAREMSNEKFDVGISREWEKFYFESTLGFGSDARELNGNENGFTGDILVGYKLSPQMHLFVFNRSNTNDYTRADLPYKQGVGLKFTRDFDKWKDFFKKNGKK